MLSGSTRLGDEYVRFCLELLVAEPKRLKGDKPKLLLYKSFHQVWDAISDQIQGLERRERAESAGAIEQILQSLAPFERRVLLLATVEDFTPEDIATILNRNAEAVETALANAVETSRGRLNQQVLIIEDEMAIAEQIAGICEDMGLTVLGIADREQEAAALAAEHQPAMILADVHLKDDDSGVKAAWQILQDNNLPVVFITGFPEKLLTGDQAEPAFVVAKPFEPEALRTTIGQALKVYHHPELAEQNHKNLFALLDKIVNMDLLAAMFEDPESGSANDREAG
jgi:CheY-like chemotaxis protein